MRCLNLHSDGSGRTWSVCTSQPTALYRYASSPLNLIVTLSNVFVSFFYSLLFKIDWIGIAFDSAFLVSFICWLCFFLLLLLLLWFVKKLLIWLSYKYKYLFHTIRARSSKYSTSIDRKKSLSIDRKIKKNNSSNLRIVKCANYFRLKNIIRLSVVYIIAALIEHSKTSTNEQKSPI